MASTYQITKDCISDTINALQNGDYSTPTAAAREVHRRLHGVSKSSRLSSNRALNLEQEQAMRDYIERLDEQNVSAKVSMIRAAANYILAKSHSDHLTTPPPVSALWTKRFLDRNLQFHKKTKKVAYSGT